jgi:hypothetical protein
MRSKRPHPRFWIYGSALIAVAGGLVLIWLVMNTTPTFRQKYEMIRIGMTEAQVRTVLGDPYHGVVPLSFEDIDVEEDLGFLERTIPHTVIYWRIKYYLVAVIFDSQKKVVGKSLARDPKG